MPEQPQSRGKQSPPPTPSTLMATLAASYPELAAFTPGATLLEVKLMYGLSNLDQVRALGRARLAERAGLHRAPSGPVRRHAGEHSHRSRRPS